MCPNVEEIVVDGVHSLHVVANWHVWNHVAGDYEFFFGTRRDTGLMHK